MSRKILQLIHEFKFPVHILTKSTLIERDIDILKKINEQNRAIVSFSFSSVDDKISAVFEPSVPSPSERLKSLAFFKNEGIACGMFLLPIIPFITDKPEVMEETIRKASEVGVDFIIFGGMTLKEGKQKDYFFNVIKKTYPLLVKKYQNIYTGSKWGNATREYYRSLNLTFNGIAKKYRIPKRIPPYLYKDILNENDLVVVLLEHIDYLLKLEGKTSPFGYVAHSVSQLKYPLSAIKGELRRLRGVGKTTERVILEILETGSSSYYEKLLRG